MTASTTDHDKLINHRLKGLLIAIFVVLFGLVIAIAFFAASIKDDSVPLHRVG